MKPPVTNNNHEILSEHIQDYNKSMKMLTELWYDSIKIENEIELQTQKHSSLTSKIKEIIEKEIGINKQDFFIKVSNYPNTDFFDLIIPYGSVDSETLQQLSITLGSGWTYSTTSNDKHTIVSFEINGGLL